MSDCLKPEEKKVTRARAMHAFRRTGFAYAAMLEEMKEVGNNRHTGEDVAIFTAIRHDYRIVQLFDKIVLETASWSRLYQNNDPYDGGLVRGVDSFRQSLSLCSSVYIRAKICAPIKYAICLMWAVEFMHEWCPAVTKAYLLHEIDSMSRYVMVHMNPGIVSMYGTLVAFVKMSIVELHEGAALQVGISIENMSKDEIEPYIKTAKKYKIVSVKNIIICTRPITEDLDFEISVLYIRNTQKSFLTYIHDCLWLHFVMPCLWHLGATSTKSAMLDRNAVCLDEWMNENGRFCREVTRKLLRASSPYETTSPTTPQEEKMTGAPPVSPPHRDPPIFNIQITPLAQAVKTAPLPLVSSNIPIKDLIEF